MPSKNRTMYLMPTLVDGLEFSLMEIPTTKVQESDIDSNTFSTFDHANPIGISPGYSPAGELIALAVADNNCCTIVEFKTAAPEFRSNRSKDRSLLRNLDDLRTKILCRPAGELFAFDMAPLAMSLYIEADLRVVRAVDLQSGVTDDGKKREDRKPLTAIKNILGESDSISINDRNVTEVFNNPIYKFDDRKSANDLAQRAWMSQLLAIHGNGGETLGTVKRIDTIKFTEPMLNMISKIANDTHRQDVKKPAKTKHQAEVVTSGSSTAVVQSKVYKNKIRSTQSIHMVAEGPAGEYVVRAQTGKVSGKSGDLAMARPLSDAKIVSITSIGRDEPTTAELQRAATIRRILQGCDPIFNDNPWIQNIWFTSNDGAASLTWPVIWSENPRAELTPPINDNSLQVLLRLNASQQNAVNTMYSTLDEHRITIIQGPPGTGKTSVIASFVQFAIQTGYDGIWLIAQSNVAVKNIAEKLMDIGFNDWRLLVSKDFIFQWHEHIYVKVKKNIINSDEFMSLNPLYALRGCKVMLCTLSMLSNRHITKFTLRIPIKTLIVDEASQIEIGGYIPVLSACTTLRKLCFIGDDRQLPPFGQEELEDLQSIFEVDHLRHHALFLDTQYRMPPQIGRVVSSLVYNGKLNSNPEHPITDKVAACRFINVLGQEERSGDSYKIISPYDGQRSAIESEMVIQGLDWKNKCFNVDSFQGNEEDYIIISLVRSRELGFLSNRRRTNVMLTRCKRGMYIVSSQKFLKGKGANTLVGEMLEEMGEGAWLELSEVQEGRF